jgi:O-antigen/teichoic acid export membrane protein
MVKDPKNTSVLRNLFRDSAIYGGSDFLAKLVAFFTFPLIAAALSSSGFGLLELTMTIIMLGGVVARCGLNNAAQRFYWDTDTSSEQRPLIVSTGLYLVVAFGVLLGVLAYILTPFIFTVGVSEPVRIGLLGLVAVALLLPFMQFAQYLQDVLRLHFSPWRFLAYSLFSRVGASILALFAVLYIGAGVEGVLAAQAFVFVLALPIGIWLIKRDVVPSFDSRWSSRLLAYGAPFIFTEIAYWLFSSIDRWMLASISGVESVGVYSVAFRFSTIVMFVATAFGMAWSPYSMKLRKDFPEQHRTIYAEILLVLLFVMLIVAGSISLFSGEIIGTLMPAEYASAAIPLAILCFTVVLQASQQITAIGISLANRTIIFTYLVWLAAILNAALNYYWIPAYGVPGAAWATVIAYLFLSGGFMVFTQRYYRLPISWMRLGWLIVLGIVIMLFSLNSVQNGFSIEVTLKKIGFALACLVLALPALNLKVLRNEAGMERS